MPDPEFVPSVKTQEDLLADRNAYMQRVIELENEEETLQEKLKENTAAIQQVRGVIAYIELILGDMQQQDIATQKEIEAEKQKALEGQKPGAPDPKK